MVGSLVLSSYLSDPFIACGEDDDGDEGHEEREGAGDAPLAEDYAEVFGGPGENHLVHVNSVSECKVDHR